MDLSSYDEDVSQYAGALIVSEGGINNFDLDLPIAVDFLSDKEFPSINQQHSMSQGRRNIKALLEEFILLVKLRQLTLQASRNVLKLSKVQKELESQERFK